MKDNEKVWVKNNQTGCLRRISREHSLNPQYMRNAGLVNVDQSAVDGTVSAPETNETMPEKVERLKAEINEGATKGATKGASEQPKEVPVEPESGLDESETAETEVELTVDSPMKEVRAAGKEAGLTFPVGTTKEEMIEQIKNV